MSLTSKDARMIAKELFRLMKCYEEKAKLETNKHALPNEELLTIDQAAAILKCSKNTIYQNIRLIPHTKVGNRLRFTERTLLDYYVSRIK